MLEAKDRKMISDIIDMMPEKVVLSNLSDKEYLYKKTVIHKYIKKDRIKFQIERFTDKQAFHENVELNMLLEMIFQLFPEKYRQMNILCEGVSYDFKVSKKGKLLSNKSGVSSYNIEETHNRKKNYILKEGMIIPPLVDLGIFTKDGRVVHSMYDKFKQINRFVELVDDVIRNYRPVNKHTLNSSGQESQNVEQGQSKDYKGEYDLNIIDFGCGKSYLTFIIYYYLVEIRGMKVKMTGLDLKADVIEKCNATAKKYQYDNLHFELGDINGYKTDQHVNMVVTLHACDTATDYALYNAICWNADIILSVPCCQHEVNAQMESEDYSILTRYGIVKERVSALMTDAIRANVLEYCGYSTQLLEFIDIAHSPKNILIRAVLKDRGKRIEYAVGDKNESKTLSLQGGKADKGLTCWNEAERLCEEFHLKQTLMELVRDKLH